MNSTLNNMENNMGVKNVFLNIGFLDDEELENYIEELQNELSKIKEELIEIRDELTEAEESLRARHNEPDNSHFDRIGA